MHDLSKIRENSQIFYHALKRRGIEPEIEEICRLDSRHRLVQKELQHLRHQRKQLSQNIPVLQHLGQDTTKTITQVTTIRQRISTLSEEERTLNQSLTTLLSRLPNLPSEEVPDGVDEKDNKILHCIGEPNPTLQRSHDDLGQTLGLMDFTRAASMSGTRFTILYGALSRLERSLAQFMLDLHTQKHGYTEVSPPLLVRNNALFGTGQLPKFAHEQFQTTNGYWLIPTAEVPLTNLVADTIVDGQSLPLRYTALTPCFRSEAGAAGKDTRGMIRQHQFLKVELVSITEPEKSSQEHERMTECAEKVLRLLKLPFRTIVLCTGDMGFSVQKTYDIEVWLPGQQAYREISSCSNCGDFQARRLKARYRSSHAKKTHFVHTLNGSGVAVGRCLIALLENYQQADGSVLIPEVLTPYMQGVQHITPHS